MRDDTPSDPADVIAQHCLATRVRFLNRAVCGIYDSALRPLGVKTSQANILVFISRRKSTTPTRLADWLHMDASTVSRNVERMRVRGWIETRPEADGRAHTLRLTRKGKALVTRLFPAWQGAQEQAHALLGPDGAQAVKDLATTVRRGAGASA